MSNKRCKDLFEKWVEAGVVENKLAIVQSLSMQGQPMAQIAEAIGVTRKTLQNLQNKHPALKKAIENGRLTVVAMCQNKLMEKVTQGDTIAIIYALKVYGGEFFNDRKTLKKTDADGSSVSVQPQVQIYLPQQTDGDQNDKKQ